MKLIHEYEVLKPLLSSSFTDGTRSILSLEANGQRDGIANAFVEALRLKYWGELFQSQKFAHIFTAKARDQYREQISDLKNYEFTLANIKQVQIDVSASVLSTLDDAIVSLFDEFSNQYWDEASKNIHYFNGWKTNKAYKVNTKVITRMDAFGGWAAIVRKYDPTHYEVREKLEDIIKVFAYLDGKLMTETNNLLESLEQAGNSDQTKRVDLGYVAVDFYKKGTAHITIKREDLLKKFNFIGSQRKGWLPPQYGAKAYEAMTPDERAVVDSFEGLESYRDTVANYEQLAAPPQLLLAETV